MATAAYREWVRNGRKWTVAQPIADVVAFAKAAGVGWLGTLGSDDTRHLQADRPQDHTPFSVTAWPLPLPGYVVTACDLKRGPWCDRFLAECRAGLHPWVKYINFGGHQYSVKTGWVQGSSSDQHFHVSARTDYLNARARNPFEATVPAQGDNMAGFGFSQEGFGDAAAWRLDALTFGLDTVRGGPSKGEAMEVIRMLKALDRKVSDLAAKPAISDDQVSKLAEKLKEETDYDVIKAALRDVFLHGVEVDGTPE